MRLDLLHVDRPVVRLDRQLLKLQLLARVQLEQVTTTLGAIILKSVIVNEKVSRNLHLERGCNPAGGSPATTKRRLDYA